MKIFVDISNTKLSYEYFEDVMNFHINSAKHCTICFRELNSFILKYAYSHKFEIEKVEKIPLGALAVIFGKNINILNGTFTSLKNNFLLSDSFKTTHPKFISGGKFTSDVSPYLKTGSLSYNDNYYQVVSKTLDNIKDLTISKKNLLPIIIIITFLIVVLINLYLYTRKKLLKKKNK